FFAAAGFDALAARWRSAGGPRPRGSVGLAKGRADRARWRAALFTAAVLLAAVVESAPRPLPWDFLGEEDDFPDVYFWLADQPDLHALLELPLEEGPAPATRGQAAIQAMYYGTLDWHPLVNGYSAHFPTEYQRFEAVCCAPMPDPQTLKWLR